MRTFLALLSFVFATSWLFCQEEGIKKGDREINVSGNIIHASYNKQFTSTNGVFNISFGRYITDRMSLGIATGMIISRFSEGNATSDMNVQIFSNFNFVKKKSLIPYMRSSIYKSSFEFEKSTFVQVGGGIKLFFSKRAAWDSLLTVGFGLNDNSGSSLLFLTGFSYIF